MEETLAQYESIALNMALRISEGNYTEGQRLPGRTVLASEYHVSPETVRKAIALLADMRVVTVKEKSGVTVLSSDNAKRYIEQSEDRCSKKELLERLQSSYTAISEASKELCELCKRVIDIEGAPIPKDERLPNYEVKVTKGSNKIGRSIGDLHFWQATGATIVAIRRNKNIIISPGPYAELYAGDVVIFVGNKNCVSEVDAYLNKKS